MNSTNQLWGGRFAGKSDENFLRFNRSFGFDHRLLAADIQSSVAHCEALRRAEVLTEAEAETIKTALAILSEKPINPEAVTDPGIEDVHSFIESGLIEIAGDLGRKLHTGRSRNDQVATAMRLWLRTAIDQLRTDLRDTQRSLVELAEQHKTAVLPGYTHLQRAQPLLFPHWCLAYFEMLKRDAERLSEVRDRVNILPLGAAAVAGTSYPIDRRAVAADLGFDGVAANSLDAVSDRDFAVEFVHASSLIMMHLSRLAEDIILYATTEFNFFELSDAVATGSSLMPQKKNPDSMELVRGKTGRVFGNLLSLLTMLKGLPLAYNKDMQEDKESVFDAFDTTQDCLQVTATVMRNIGLREERTLSAATEGYLNATELADYLAKKGVPFRTAHELAGQVVLRAIEAKVELNELALEELQKHSSLIEADVFEALSLEQTLKSKNAIGGTSPEQVEAALRTAREYCES